MQRPGLHLAQGRSLRVGGDRVPGDVSGRGRLGPGGPAALHDRRLLRQEAAHAQDGEQEAAEAQVRPLLDLRQVKRETQRRLTSDPDMQRAAVGLELAIKC